MGKTFGAVLFGCPPPDNFHLISVSDVDKILELLARDLRERLAGTVVAKPRNSSNPTHGVHDVPVKEEPRDGVVVRLKTRAACSRVPLCSWDIEGAQKFDGHFGEISLP